MLWGNFFKAQFWNTLKVVLTWSIKDSSFFFRLESEHLFKMKIPKFYKIDIPQCTGKLYFY